MKGTLSCQSKDKEINSRLAFNFGSKNGLLQNVNGDVISEQINDGFKAPFTIPSKTNIMHKDQNNRLKVNTNPVIDKCAQSNCSNNPQNNTTETSYKKLRLYNPQEQEKPKLQELNQRYKNVMQFPHNRKRKRAAFEKRLRRCGLELDGEETIANLRKIIQPFILRDFNDILNNYINKYFQKAFTNIQENINLSSNNWSDSLRCSIAKSIYEKFCNDANIEPYDSKTRASTDFSYFKQTAPTTTAPTNKLTVLQTNTNSVVRTNNEIKANKNHNNNNNNNNKTNNFDNIMTNGDVESDDEFSIKSSNSTSLINIIKKDDVNTTNDDNTNNCLSIYEFQNDSFTNDDDNQDIKPDVSLLNLSHKQNRLQTKNGNVLPIQNSALTLSSSSSVTSNTNSKQVFSTNSNHLVTTTSFNSFKNTYKRPKFSNETHDISSNNIVHDTMSVPAHKLSQNNMDLDSATLSNHQPTKPTLSSAPSVSHHQHSNSSIPQHNHKKFHNHHQQVHSDITTHPSSPSPPQPPHFITRLSKNHTTNSILTLNNCNSNDYSHFEQLPQLSVSNVIPKTAQDLHSQMTGLHNNHNQSSFMKQNLTSTAASVINIDSNYNKHIFSNRSSSRNSHLSDALSINNLTHHQPMNSTNHQSYQSYDRPILTPAGSGVFINSGETVSAHQPGNSSIQHLSKQNVPQ